MAGILAVVGSQSESLAVVAVVPQAVAVELLTGDNYPGHLQNQNTVLMCMAIPLFLSIIFINRKNFCNIFIWL